MSDIEAVVKETNDLTKKWYNENTENYDKIKNKEQQLVWITVVFAVIMALAIGYVIGYQIGYDAAFEDITRKLILNAIGVDL